jgi:hypothetical protein
MESNGITLIVDVRLKKPDQRIEKKAFWKIFLETLARELGTECSVDITQDGMSITGKQFGQNISVNVFYATHMFHMVLDSGRPDVSKVKLKALLDKEFPQAEVELTWKEWA